MRETQGLATLPSRADDEVSEEERGARGGARLGGEDRSAEKRWRWCAPRGGERRRRVRLDWSVSFFFSCMMLCFVCNFLTRVDGCL